MNYLVYKMPANIVKNGHNKFPKLNLSTTDIINRYWTLTDISVWTNMISDMLDMIYNNPVQFYLTNSPIFKDNAIKMIMK